MDESEERTLVETVALMGRVLEEQSEAIQSLLAAATTSALGAGPTTTAGPAPAAPPAATTPVSTPVERRLVFDYQRLRSALGHERAVTTAVGICPVRDGLQIVGRAGDGAQRAVFWLADGRTDSLLHWTDRGQVCRPELDVPFGTPVELRDANDDSVAIGRWIRPDDMRIPIDDGGETYDVVVFTSEEVS
jgi:hypothetical protein